MDDDILQEFLAESWENLGQLDTEIVSLEKEPSNAELLASIFRTIHTIKGTCGFIGLTNLGNVAHSAENVLGKMRERELDVTPDAISLVLRAIDVIKELLEGLEATGEEPSSDHSALIAELDHLAENGSIQGGGEATPATSTDEIASNETAEPVASTQDESEPPPSSSPTQAESEPVVEHPEFSMDGTETAEASAEAASTTSSGKKSVSELSIRVNVDVLDSLMNLVGELVLARNQLLQLARGDDESKYAAPIAHLNRVTTDLQEGVMKTRMQPIGNAWSKLPRLVRDLMQITGRHIELEMSGAETELDRTVLDAIKDPLTHMVRNSADHGIESPEKRRELGKPEFGTIRLNAYHEGGHVIISIEDDGAGINTKRVLKKAVENGVVSEAEASKLSHNEILQLVFRPAFSTAEQVSSVSGRGVGMDVVRTQIERIGGTVDLSSKEGVGTTVRIKIPLTLAIISALVVESGGQSFAIPQLGVVELVRLTVEDRTRIEKIHDNEVFRLRDRLLPLVHLDRVLDLKQTEEDDDRDINIVVVQVGDMQFGLIVSEVFDTEEIVVKPVGRLLKDVPIYQGTTILGDGRVVMILDVAGIANEFSNATSAGHEIDTSSDSDAQGDKTSLLLFGSGAGTTMSVPLSLVARLEEFPQDAIEHSADRTVVQYRGDLLPILPVSGHSAGETKDPQPVIVFSEGDRSMGLMVDEIQDILEERLTIRMQSQRPGVLGTAIINGKATDVIDTQHYVIQANPSWFQRHDPNEKRRILTIDDSLFFRQLVKTTLETENYIIESCDSAVSALELLEHGRRFDAIISDIEMPMMDGYEFAEWVRSNASTSEVPLIALTSLNSHSAESRAMEVGFNRFLTKFNARQLVDTISELCRNSQALTGASA
ncbi:MAG: chemotaxis protein CheW [Planctomycetaceae bacterium]